MTAATAIALLLLYVIYGIFDQANSLDSSYARRSAMAALQSLRNETTRAAEAGVAGTEGAFFLVDAAGQTIAASVKGQRSGLTARDYLGGNLDALMKARQPVFFLSGSGLTLAAAAQKGTTLSVAATKIEPGRLVALAGQYALPGLRFDSPGLEGIAILSATGGPIATLRWTERNPGNIARAQNRDTITAALTTFMFVVGLLIYMSWRGFQEAHESKARAIAASLRDDLTGLANRRSMLAALETLKSTGAGRSVIYADLDGFNEVNDAYGRDVGDQVLKAAAAGFEFLAEGKHLVARFGGDEFAIITEGDGHQDAAIGLARNMIAFLAVPMVFEGRVASVAASIGIVHASDAPIDAEELLRRAEVAMYAAKDSGRNHIQLYDPSLDQSRDEDRTIAKELRAIIEQRQLAVLYQPIVDARTRRIAGVEALVRWPESSSRHITPDIFVTVAEKHGLIEELGHFVLTEAFRAASLWEHITVSVNVSPIQFMNPAFAELVEHALAATGLEAKRLEIEVTEGFVIDNGERTMAIIDKLRNLRVSLVLDDFGTGYSSIGHLRRFKFDKLKLDRSMVKEILHHPSSLRLVQGTIAMADALGLQVTAEGIEDESQVAVLRLAGCSQFQGYLFSSPVEAGEITAVLNNPETAIAVGPPGR